MLDGINSDGKIASSPGSQKLKSNEGMHRLSGGAFLERHFMKFLIVLFASMFLILTAASAQIVIPSNYSNLDDSDLSDNGGPGGIGWGSCVSCAGGSPNGTASISSSPFITSPSIDGSSRDFYISGSPYKNGLWWYKVGPNDSVSHFKMDFWLNVASSTQYAQALEFDTFQFNQQLAQFPAGTEFMFGTQCNYAAGVWDVWDMGNSVWSPTFIPCHPFKPNTWYHVTLNFHTMYHGSYQSYDSLTIAQYNSSGKRVTSGTYKFYSVVASGPMPAGWSENMGIQFQMDIGGTGASMTEYVDDVSLTVW